MLQHKQALCATLAQLQIQTAQNEILAPYTTFKIGGPAQVLCFPKNIQQLAQILQLCKQYKARYHVLCHGSNVLFADEGFCGVVIVLRDLFSKIEIKGTLVSAQAGASLQSLCEEAQKASLTGLEFAYGIPGGVGGAVYMNAGAYHGEIKDVLESVTVLNEDGEEQIILKKDLQFGYRTSILQQKPWCVISAVFSLVRGNAQHIKETMEHLMHRRKEKQPLEMPSAGSTFKRPQGAYAGALIDECNLRGFQIGGAAVSTKHCGFVVNAGGATCADVLELTDKIQQIVKEKTGFVLEREVRVIR